MTTGERITSTCDKELELTRAAVKDLLAVAYDEAEQFGVKVGDLAKSWWVNHYEKSFLYAFVAKGLTEAMLRRDWQMLLALAKVLGRAAGQNAKDDGKSEVNEQHAWRSSHVVDCSLTARADDQPSIRAEWCN